MDLILDLPHHGQVIVKNYRNTKSKKAILKKLNNRTLSHSSFIQFNGQDLIIQQAFLQPVENVIRYSYQYLGKHQFKKVPLSSSGTFIKNSNYQDISFSPTAKQGRLVGLILESPHADEFQYNYPNITPVAPAQNQAATGGKIDRDIKKVLEELSKGRTMKKINFTRGEIIDIALLNPVPFQTSLFHLHKKPLKKGYVTLRNNVWKNIWALSSIQLNFNTILNNFTPNDILINCCTHKLQPILQLYLKQYISTNPVHLLSGDHPSTIRGRWWKTIK